MSTMLSRLGSTRAHLIDEGSRRHRVLGASADYGASVLIGCFFVTAAVVSATVLSTLGGGGTGLHSSSIDWIFYAVLVAAVTAWSRVLVHRVSGFRVVLMLALTVTGYEASVVFDSFVGGLAGTAGNYLALWVSIAFNLAIALALLVLVVRGTSLDLVRIDRPGNVVALVLGCIYVLAACGLIAWTWHNISLAPSDYSGSILTALTVAGPVCGLIASLATQTPEPPEQSRPEPPGSE